MKNIEDKVIKTEKISWKNFEFLQKATFKDINKDQFQKLKTSIIKNDFIETFKVWQNGKAIYCLDGFHRCKALESLEQDGYTVPQQMSATFVQCKNKEDAAKKVLIYSSQYASVTDEGLYEFSHDYNINFDDIKLEIDIPKLDLDKYEAGYVHDGEYNEEEDIVPEPPKEPVAKLGDLYLLGGRHRLLCGDATNSEDVARLMDGKKADMVFTSPPYNLGVSARLSGNSAISIKGNVYEGYNDTQSENDWLDLMIRFTEVALSFSQYVFVNVQTLAGNRTALPRYWSKFAEYYSDLAIWDKQHAPPAAAERVMNSRFEMIFIFTKDNPNRAIRTAPKFRGTLDNVYTAPPQRNNEASEVHGATFPVHLPLHFISHFTHKDDSILDMFGGSGTTLIACEQTNRICYMMEIEPMYTDVIIERYKNLTGKEVELIDRDE